MMEEIKFEEKWITDGANANLPKFAEQKGRLMAGFQYVEVSVEGVDELAKLVKDANDLLKQSKPSRNQQQTISPAQLLSKAEDCKKCLVKIAGEQPRLNGKTGESLLREIKKICSREGAMSNSQIRNVYGEVKRIQMSGDFDNSKMSFYLLKPKMAYAYGRSNNNPGMKVFKGVFDQASNLVDNEKTFLNFCNLMEALLAYHRAFGGK